MAKLGSWGIWLCNAGSEPQQHHHKVPKQRGQGRWWVDYCLLPRVCLSLLTSNTRRLPIHKVMFGWCTNTAGLTKAVSTSGNIPEFQHIPTVFFDLSRPWHSWVCCNLSGALTPSCSWSCSLFLQVLWDEMKLANPNAQQAGRAC